MTSRERWIVYPLLFLTLGIAMRDKVIPPQHFVAEAVMAAEIGAQRVYCRDLVADRARFSQTDTDQAACGELEVKSWRFLLKPPADKPKKVTADEKSP